MPNMLEEIRVEGYERVIYCENQQADLRALISIHNTNLGPSCGGIRLYPYRNKEEALTDVLRLSKGMSYKSSLANIKFGGGKSVILSHPSQKTPAMFQAFGQLVESLSGRYIAAKDMNVDGNDLAEVKKTTRYVLGIEGEENSGGDPSPLTARGLFAALRATLKFLKGSESLKGIKVAIQGLGHVGADYARRIVEAGGTLTAADVNQTHLNELSKKFGFQTVSNEEIFSVPCDIFSPCAIGAVLNSKTIPTLRCQAVVGAANNQLATPADGQALFDRGILYAPDYVVNAGGIINIYIEHVGYDPEKANQKADEIFDTLTEIYTRSKNQGVAPFLIADQLAEERLYGGR